MNINLRIKITVKNYKISFNKVQSAPFFLSLHFILKFFAQFANVLPFNKFYRIFVGIWHL